MVIQNNLKRFFAAFGVVLLANIVATLFNEVELERNEFSVSVVVTVALISVSAVLFYVCWQGFSPREKCEKCGR